MSPPDWNWADFCGKQLVLMELRHGERYPKKLQDKVRNAVFNACDAIILRNVGPSYTNIAIMGAFVTLVAGERYDHEEYRSYGLERLEKLAAYTRQRGAFQEYNSPTYTYVAIVELSKIASSASSSKARAISHELLHMAWRSVGDYYHASTGQWSGPHSRCYQTLLSDQTKAFLQLSTRGALEFFSWEELPYDEEWYGCAIACPDEHIGTFLASETKTIRQCYGSGENGDKLAITYMTPAFTIGSFSHEIMWNQRRSLIAYIDNGGEAAYAHLRFLHDGYDYCSAVFHSAQEDGHVLFGISFLAKGGDTHPNLDLMNGSIEATDLKLRLEIGGCLDRISAEENGSGAEVSINGIPLQLHTWHASFGDRLAGTEQWRISREGGKLHVDFVLYDGEGERTKIDFQRMEQAALVFSMFVGASDQESAFAPEISIADGIMNVAGRWLDREMRLSLPTRPAEQ